jgi:hypothetical protein
VSTEQERSALPHLYGAPAHRPRVNAPEPERPLGPDDLPIENVRSPEDEALATELFPRSYGTHAMDLVAVTTRPMSAASTGTAVATAPPMLRARPLLLRALAGRLMRPRGN